MFILLHHLQNIPYAIYGSQQYAHIPYPFPYLVVVGDAKSKASGLTRRVERRSKKIVSWQLHPKWKTLNQKRKRTECITPEIYSGPAPFWPAYLLTYMVEISIPITHTWQKKSRDTAGQTRVGRKALGHY